MNKGWRVFFYSAIGLAVVSIMWITIKFIATERLVKATGAPELEARQRAAVKVMNRDDVADPVAAIEFLGQQPQTVRDNVVWSLEPLAAGDGPDAERALRWLVAIARDLSGSLPTGDTDDDRARLALLRIGAKAVDPLIETLEMVTQRTLLREPYAHRRAVAARLLGLIGDERAIEPLIKALRDEYSLVRLQAAAALARFETPVAEAALVDYLAPYLGILQGRYRCYVRADSEGRVRVDPNRDDLLYGPFDVVVMPHETASEEDLQRQRDSALAIEEAEERRRELTRKRLEAGKQGQVLKTVKGDADLAIEAVRLQRTGLVVSDPAAEGAPEFTLIEGEPMEIQVDMVNKGPADLVTDYYVALYAGSPRPRNHVDKPESGPYAGEPARDNRALAGVADGRHVRTMYATDRPETEDVDNRETIYITIGFDTVESDRIEVLRQLMYIGHESCIEALGAALADNSYTVRREAARALEGVLTAAKTSPEAKLQIAELLREVGLNSDDAVVRCRCAAALQYAEDPTTADVLKALLLTDPDQTVRQVATRALAALPRHGREKLLPALVATDPGIRLVSPRLFHSEGDEEVLRRLIFSPDLEVAREVLRTGGRLLGTEHLLAGLQLPDNRSRTQAARLLAERADPASRAGLLRALDDSDGKVRTAVAEALGKLLKQNPADEDVISALIDVIDKEAGDYVGVPVGEQPENPENAVITNKQARAAAAAALVGVDNQAAKDALAVALQDANPDVLRATVPAAGRGDLGDQSERLIVIIKDNKMPAQIRQRAVLALWHSNSNTPETLDALVGLLNDPIESVKTAAAVSLIGLGDSRGDKVLKDQITSKNADIKRDAATLLATLPAEVVKGIDGLKADERDGMHLILEELYASGSLPVNFRFLCRSLTYLGQQDGNDVAARMAAAMQDSHPVMRAAAVTVMAELDPDGAAAAVVPMLSDSEAFVRGAACDAAAKLRLEEAYETVQELAFKGLEPSSDVRDRARQAVASIRQRA